MFDVCSMVENSTCLFTYCPSCTELTASNDDLTCYVQLVLTEPTMLLLRHLRRSSTSLAGNEPRTRNQFFEGACWWRWWVTSTLPGPSPRISRSGSGTRSAAFGDRGLWVGGHQGTMLTLSRLNTPNKEGWMEGWKDTR